MAKPSPIAAFRSECQAWRLARTPSFQRPISFQVCDGMWFMWLAPGTTLPRNSAQAAALPGSTVDSVAWT